MLKDYGCKPKSNAANRIKSSAIVTDGITKIVSLSKEKEHVVRIKSP